MMDGQIQTTSKPASLIYNLVEHKTFKRAILAVIVLNAIILGLETTEFAQGNLGTLLVFIDKICLGIFCIEIALKLVAHRFSFFKNGWNIFDLLIVSIAFIPDAGGLAVLRTLRIFRAFRLLSAVPSMRRLVAALLKSIPGVS
ncbi:MAG: ion transporter, partial [Alphaproteobacteria bacterium]|nr:ion transporter [Alphaproteobacteria bacterium]